MHERVRPRCWVPGAVVCALGFGLWASACTKVVEQPAATAPPPASAVPAPAPAPRRAAPTPSRAPAWPPPEAAPAPTPEAPPPVLTLNGDPKGLRREDVNRMIDGMMPALAGCLQAAGGAVAISFTADPSGRVDSPRATGAPAQAEACLVGVVSRLAIPPFGGKAIPVDFPLTIHRAPQPAAPAPAAQAPAPPPAPAPAPTPQLGVVPGAIPTTAPTTGGLPTMQPKTAAGSGIFVKP